MCDAAGGGTATGAWIVTDVEHLSSGSSSRWLSESNSTVWYAGVGIARESEKLVKLLVRTTAISNQAYSAEELDV
jgi:hypothetical protein